MCNLNFPFDYKTLNWMWKLNYNLKWTPLIKTVNDKLINSRNVSVAVIYIRSGLIKFKVKIYGRTSTQHFNGEFMSMHKWTTHIYLTQKYDVLDF
jgi:hypothetical protein